MRTGMIIAALLLATPAAAKDITITLNDNEQAQLNALLDLAVRQGGVRAAQVVTYFVQKLAAAGRPEPEAPKAEEPKPDATKEPKPPEPLKP